MFKALCFILILLSPLAQAQEKPYIISGFDDVLRQAENTGLIKVALKIFEKDKSFAGMAELYQVISKEEKEPHFVLVSAITDLLESRIENFLVDAQFPSSRLYLRNWFTQWSIGSFKMDKIKEIIAAKPQRKYIVIFDNSAASLHLATEIQKQFAHNVAAVYLRNVVSTEVPAGAIGFYTAFDIAVKEYTQGRLSVDEVNEVAEALLRVTNIEMIIPHYAQCPKAYDPCPESSGAIVEACTNVQRHIQKMCGAR